MKLGAWLLVILLFPIAAVAQTYTYLDPSLKNGGAVHTALLIAPDVSVSEISAGGVVEKLPGWSRPAAANIDSALRRIGRGGKPKLADAPQLNARERHAPAQPVALHRRFALTMP